MQLENIFTVTAKNIYEVVARTGSGFYIPPYQRNYEWKNDNVSRLFEDTTRAIDQLLDRADSFNFIGTFILIHDQRYESIKPIYNNQVPSRVNLVIDGQQRMSTILVICRYIHKELKKADKVLSRPKYDITAADQLRQNVANLAQMIEHMLHIKQACGEGEYQYYPKMIRAYDDTWSFRKSSARYTSPIASFLISFTREIMDPPVYAESEASSLLAENHRQFDNVIRAIEKQLKKIMVSDGDDTDDSTSMPSLDRMLSSQSLQVSLFQFEFSSETTEFFRTAEPIIIKILRLVTFGNFLLHRTAVTLVETSNDAYAFDMFEALNTTGVPLTSIETFKPKVIELEGMTTFEDSESRKYFMAAEAFVTKFTAPNGDKLVATSELLLPFALWEDGTKLSKHLSSQRHWLTRKFSSFESTESKREFVKRMGKTALFMEYLWHSDEQQQGPFIADEPTKLCLRFLKDSGHKICIAALTRIFSDSLTAPPSHNNLSSTKTEQYVKALTAFVVIYRTSRSTTGGIDSLIRSVTQQCLSILENPLIPKTVDEFRTVLVSKLREAKDGNISSYEEWAQKANTLQIYSVSSSIARFLLMAAFHDSVPTGDSGHVGSGRSGVLPIFNLDGWNKWTVEHIAPQRPDSEKTDNELYSGAGLQHTLGNLSLLPAEVNAALSNLPYAEKKRYFQALSSASHEELEALCSISSDADSTRFHNARDLIEENGYLGHLESIGQANQWDARIVRSRSSNLCKRVWNHFAPWLSLDKVP